LSGKWRRSVWIPLLYFLSKKLSSSFYLSAPSAKEKKRKEKKEGRREGEMAPGWLCLVCAEG
jgi:hypothetical protein